jgi:hypothetical protein
VNVATGEQGKHHGALTPDFDRHKRLSKEGTGGSIATPSLPIEMIRSSLSPPIASNMLFPFRCGLGGTSLVTQIVIWGVGFISIGPVTEAQVTFMSNWKGLRPCVFPW